MNIGNILDETALAFIALVTSGLEQWFGDAITQPVLGPITMSDLCVTACFVILFFILDGTAAFILKLKTGRTKTEEKHLKRNFFQHSGQTALPIDLDFWNLHFRRATVVEKQNHTLRMHCRRLTYLTNAFSKKLENYEAAIAMNFCYYNFVKTHGAIHMILAQDVGMEKKRVDGH